MNEDEIQLDNRSLAERVEMLDSQEPRCACVVLLDASASMQGEPIAELNKGLKSLKEELGKDPQASLRVEVAVVTFNSRVQTLHDFSTIDDFEPPVVEATGLTSMGAGIERALDMVEERKTEYKQAKINYYQPWVFMITDGAPTDSIERAAQRVREMESQRKVAFFAVGVQGADMESLGTIATPDRAPLKLEGLKFVELFCWLSGSLASVGASQPGEKVELGSTSGWARVG